MYVQYTLYTCMCIHNLERNQKTETKDSPAQCGPLTLIAKTMNYKNIY